MTNTPSQNDLLNALDDYRAAVAEAAAVAEEWHTRLEGGEVPTAAQIANFQTQGKASNEKVKQAWDRYCNVSKVMYELWPTHEGKA